MANTHCLVTSSLNAKRTTNNFTGYGASSITVMAWVRTKTDNGNAMIANVNDGSQSTFQIIKVDNSYRFDLDTTSPTSSALIPEASVETGDWVHLAGTYDGANIKIYLNGTQYGSNVAKTGNIRTGSPTRLGIGVRSTGSDLPFVGKIDDVKVFNIALTQSEIQAYMSDQSFSASTTGLTGWWKLDNSNADSQTNITANDLVSVGSPTFDTDRAYGPLTDYLIAYWKLDGNSNDALGSRNGTDSGSPSYAAGKLSDGVTYNGSSSYATISNHSSLFPTSLTVSLWVKFTTVQQNKSIFTLQNANASPYAGFSIFVEDSANGKKVWSATRSTSFGWVASTNNLNDGSWHHIVVTFDAGVHTIWVDGSQNAQNTGKTLAWDSAADLQFGKFYNYAGGYYNGSLDEVGYWSRALTNAEIASLYNSGSGLAYPFSAGSSSKIKSADGVLLANIKSSNGAAIANIKSSSGVSNV